MEFPILFGDLEGWVRIIIVLLFLLSPLLNWLGGGKPDKPKQQPQRPLPQPPGKPQRQAQPMGQGRAALENDIEDFLRRAGRGGERPPAERAQPPRPAAEPRPGTRQARPPQIRPAAAKRGEKIQRPQPAGQKHAQPPAKPIRRPLGEGIGRHVREHIEANPVSDHSQELGRGLGLTDERVEDHIHEVFDHNLGQLDKDRVFRDAEDGTDAAVWDKKAAASQAAALLHLFRDPQSIRQAIILTEVFKRPPGLDD